jgi:hypothetical protein
VGTASTKEAVIVGGSVPLIFGKETNFTKTSIWNACDMENFERLSNKVLIRTCYCGIIFKTYDLKKVYHSNRCRTNYVRAKAWRHDSPKK